MLLLEMKIMISEDLPSGTLWKNGPFIDNNNNKLSIKIWWCSIAISKITKPIPLLGVKHTVRSNGQKTPQNTASHSPWTNMLLCNFEAHHLPNINHDQSIPVIYSAKFDDIISNKACHCLLENSRKYLHGSHQFSRVNRHIFDDVSSTCYPQIVGYKTSVVATFVYFCWFNPRFCSWPIFYLLKHSLGWFGFISRFSWQTMT